MLHCQLIDKRCWNQSGSVLEYFIKIFPLLLDIVWNILQIIKDDIALGLDGYNCLIIIITQIPTYLCSRKPTTR